MQLTALRWALGYVILATVVTAQTALPVLLDQLSSSDWRLRSKAVGQIAKTPGALQDSQVRAALLAALDKDNQFSRSNLRLAAQNSLSAEYLEAFGEYYAELLGLVEGFADYESPDVLRILAQGIYNPDSKFAGKLAQHVDKFLPTLIEDAASDIPLVRMNAVGFIGEILHRLRPRTLKAEGASQLMLALTKSSTIDDDEEVRNLASVVLRRIADVNGDGKVDCADWAIVTASLDKKSGEPGFDRRADIAFRGTVGKEDLAYVSQYLSPRTTCGR
jgi:hypothetical protein